VGGEFGVGGGSGGFLSFRRFVGWFANRVRNHGFFVIWGWHGWE